jgi:hypothetical protein
MIFNLLPYFAVSCSGVIAVAVLSQVTAYYVLGAQSFMRSYSSLNYAVFSKFFIPPPAP